VPAAAAAAAAVAAAAAAAHETEAGATGATAAAAAAAVPALAFEADALEDGEALAVVVATWLTAVQVAAAAGLGCASLSTVPPHAKHAGAETAHALGLRS